MRGKIKSVFPDKGFGFIRTKEGSEFFFHKSDLMDCSIDDLQKGDEMEFEEGEGPKGPRAERVFRV